MLKGVVGTVASWGEARARAEGAQLHPLLPTANVRVVATDVCSFLFWHRLPKGGKKILDFYVKYFYVKSDLKFGSSMQKKFKLSVDKWIFRSHSTYSVSDHNF